MTFIEIISRLIESKTEEAGVPVYHQDEGHCFFSDNMNDVFVHVEYDMKRFEMEWSVRHRDGKDTQKLRAIEAVMEGLTS